MTAVHDGRLHGLRLRRLTPRDVGRAAWRRRLAAVGRAPAAAHVAQARAAAGPAARPTPRARQHGDAGRAALPEAHIVTLQVVVSLLALVVWIAALDIAYVLVTARKVRR